MNEDQVLYVVGQLKSGVSEEVLKSTLHTHGYSDALITTLLQEAHQRLAREGHSQATETEATPATTVSSVVALPGIGALLREALHFVFSHKKLLALYGLVQFGVTTFLAAGTTFLLFHILLFSSSTNVTFYEGTLIVMVSMFLLVFLVLLITMFTAGALAYAILKQGHASFWEGIKWTLSHFWSFTWVSLLSTLVVISGVSFFVVPGIILAIYLSLWLPVFIREDTRGLAALVRSTQLLRGYWWAVLIRIFTIAIICGLANLLIAVVAAPFTGATMGEIYGIADIVFLIAQLTLQIIATAVVLHVAGSIHTVLAQRTPHFDQKSAGFLRGLYAVLAGIAMLVISVCIPVAVFFALTVGSGETMTSSSDNIEYIPEAMITDVPTSPDVPYELNSVQDNFMDLANTYADFTGSYAGMCNMMSTYAESDDVAVLCSDNQDAFAVMVITPEGMNYCFDSTGFSGDNDGVLLDGQTQCPEVVNEETMVDSN